jgi:GNAT superfamily N-acetyltransferase
MDQVEIVLRKPTAGQLLDMRACVGWPGRELEDARMGLEGTLFGVCAMLGDEIVGMARVVGDGRTVFYVQDVIVRPGHQGNGIGRALMEKVMEYIDANACRGAVVGLMAARGKEPFYVKFGFRARPNDREGAGMIQFWKL